MKLLFQAPILPCRGSTPAEGVDKTDARSKLQFTLNENNFWESKAMGNSMETSTQLISFFRQSALRTRRHIISSAESHLHTIAALARFDQVTDHASIRANLTKQQPHEVLDVKCTPDGYSYGFCNLVEHVTPLPPENVYFVLQSSSGDFGEHGKSFILLHCQIFAQMHAYTS
ncbi:unnamed protein product [Protopolystoma xenopodis]|uniref:Uncharacterized protein n=1 Tax=Protopolystoma xenopodis TaxID=117903 RepID=A0A3S5CLF9_9PLAT|nr:unnamed protein product [Protopolystoma xenopodis]